MAPTTPPGNRSTPCGPHFILNGPADPNWQPRQSEIPEAFRRTPLILLPAPPARDWSILQPYFPTDLQKLLRECRWDYWHRQRKSPFDGLTDEDALPNGCGDRTRCGYCAFTYARQEADEEFEIASLVHIATGAPLLSIEVELPPVPLSRWAPRAAERGCTEAQERGRLCACARCAAAPSLQAEARDIENSFVKRVIDATRSLMRGCGGVRVSACAREQLPFSPVYTVTVHVPLISVGKSDRLAPISPPDVNTFLANLNKRTVPAGLGQVTAVSIKVATTEQQIADNVWASNVPLLAHAVREARQGFRPTVAEVRTTVARLELPGPSGRGRHRRRSWFGIFANGSDIEKALGAMQIFPLPEMSGTPKKIIDKLRPFARSGTSVSVQSLWTGDEKAVPAAWFQREPLMNRYGFVIAPVRRSKWRFHPLPREGGGLKCLIKMIDT